ncbi:MAG: YARHG domain-containing protein [Lachnospiraceae bacterium]|nr:YARHG domain-containing protein [Lachnospiraceae bacterium]
MEKMKDFIPDLKWNIMAFIINLMSGIIVIIEGFYSFGYWIIVKLMPRIVPNVSPFLSEIEEFLFSHRKLIAYGLFLEAAILLYKYIALEIKKCYAGKIHNPILEIKYPAWETILFIILSAFLILEFAAGNKAASRHYDSKSKCAILCRGVTTIDGKRFTDKFTAINETDEDKVMMNLIYEMTAEALEYGIIDVDENYDAEHVREKVAVEYYVLESANRDISVKEWGELSNEELYYIRNGIFAYQGCCFNSGYYDVFLWYEGNIMLKDFDYRDFNDHQYKNIMNILYVEGQRENSQAE